MRERAAEGGGDCGARARSVVMMELLRTWHRRSAAVDLVGDVVIAVESSQGVEASAAGP